MKAFFWGTGVRTLAPPKVAINSRDKKAPPMAHFWGFARTPPYRSAAQVGIIPQMRRLLVALTLGLPALGCTADEAPRILSVSLTGQTPDFEGPYQVVVRADDDRTLDRVELVYSIQDPPLGPLTVPLVESEPTRWVGALPAQPLGTVVRYRARAQAGDAETYWPESPLEALELIVGNVPSRPELYAVWPDRGPTTGGTEVLLVGQDLRPGLIARFGGRPAETLSVLSRTQATVRTPPGPAGWVEVSLTQPDGGAAARADAFFYFPAPEILEVTPDHGPVAGGTRVTIRGRHFPPVGTGFLFDGLPAIDVVIISDVEARAVTPPHPAGLVTVRVEHPTDGFGEKTNAYEYIPPPEVLAVDPNRGPDLGGTPVIISGRHFQPNPRVLFGGRPALDVQFVDSTRLTARTPPHPVGFADVVVENSDGQSGTLPRGFLYIGPPDIVQVLEPWAASSGGATVRILGANFEIPTRVEIIQNGQSFALACTFVGAGELSCRTPAAPVGPYRVVVTNSDGRSDSLEDGLTLFRIDFVSPTRGPAAGGTSVELEGVFLPPTTGISFGPNNPANCLWVSPTRIDCVTPPGPPNQFVDVLAQPSGVGQVPSNLPNGYFYVSPPVITGLTPDEGPTYGGTTITISGDFFQPGATVTIGGVACQDVVVVNARTITCTVPAHGPGLAEVVVTNPDGQTGAFLGFDYVPISFEPNWSLVDGFSNLIIRGVNLTPNAIVRIDGVIAPAFQFIDDHTLKVRAPPRNTTGSVEVLVQIPGRPNDVATDRFSYRIYRERTEPSMFGTDETSDVKIVDLDGDGDQDLVYINGSVDLAGRSEILENLGSGQGFLTTSFGLNQVGNEGGVCDTNGDGLPELIWGTSGQAVPYFRNRGNLNLALSPLPSDPADAFEAGFFDVDADGDCDIISLSISAEDSVLINDGNGRFRALPSPMANEPGFVHDHKVDVGDLNQDGIPDIVVVVDDVNFGVPPSQRHRIYLGQGNGTWLEDLQNRPLLETLNGDIYDVRVGDVDLDGDLDLVMPAFNRVPIILLNDGVGRFSRSFDLPQIPRPDSSILLEDVEGDGDLDLLLISLDFSTSSALFLNDGLGHYTRAVAGEPPGGFASYRAAIGDVSGDGRNDLLFGAVFDNNRLFFAEE